MLFADRADAGRRLAASLDFLAGQDVVVVGLPRGGVPVALEVARVLRAPLDVVIVVKLGVPGRAELAMGAVGESGVRVINEDVVRSCRVSEHEVAKVERNARAEVARRAARFRGDRERVAIAGRTGLVVDDGIATGATVRAACQIVRAHGAVDIVLAAPVAPAQVVHGLSDVADRVVCPHAPANFGAVGRFYADFDQISDAEVRASLRVGAG